MKLFVWTNFSRDYTPGLAFAIAKDKEQARKLVIKSYGFEPSDWGDLTIHSVSKPIAYQVAGGG